MVKYKPLFADSSSAFKMERSLDTITFSGSYLVEIDHNDTDVGLPFEYCNENHYIVGTLVVTDSGTGGPIQSNRVIGQVLTLTSRKEKETKVYSRTLVDDKWSDWRSLALAGMYDRISSTDELVATVTGLVDEIKKVDAECLKEVSALEERMENSFNNKITPITGVFYYEKFSGNGTQDSDMTHHLVAGEKYIITAKREQYISDYTVIVSMLNRETDGTLKGFTIAGDEVETSVEYTPIKDVDVYIRFYTGYADNVTTLSIQCKSELEKVKDTAELVWDDATDAASMLDGNNFITSAGDISGTSKNFRVLAIDGRAVKRIKVYVAGTDSGASFIAFYNSDTMSADTMINNIVSKATTMWCESEVPDGCKLIGITNNYDLLSNPEILCVADGIKGFNESQTAIAANAERLKALDPQQTLLCSNYLYTNSGVENAVSRIYYLTERDNETIKGAFITGMIVNVLGAGTLSLYLAENVELDSRVETLVEDISVTQLGVQVIRFSNPVAVGVNQTFGFKMGFKHAVSTTYAPVGYMGVRYVYNGVFTSSNKDFGFGLVGMKKYDSTEEYPITRGILGSFINRTNPYYDHLFIDKINGIDVTIPSESIYSVAISKRLGFDMLELNVNVTSDARFVVMHGESGNFGSQFEHIDGRTDISEMAINSVTLEWIKSNVRYKSKYPKYRTAPSTLEEMLYECKRNGIIPFVQRKDVKVNNAWTNSIVVADRIMGEGNYVSYGGGARRETSAPIYYYGSESSLEAILAVCNKFGAPFIYGMNGVTKFSDEELKTIVDTLHNKGYFVAFAGSYQKEPLNQKLLAMGFDMSASGWNVPVFTDSNIVCADSFDQFTHNGSVNDGVLTLNVGNTVSVQHSGNVPFLSVGLLQIRFNGKLNIIMGDYINNTFESDGDCAMTLTTYYMEKAPVFSITAIEGTAIKEILFKAAKR